MRIAEKVEGWRTEERGVVNRLWGLPEASQGGYGVAFGLWMDRLRAGASNRDLFGAGGCVQACGRLCGGPWMGRSSGVLSVVLPVVLCVVPAFALAVRSCLVFSVVSDACEV